MDEYSNTNDHFAEKIMQESKKMLRNTDFSCDLTNNQKVELEIASKTLELLQRENSLLKNENEELHKENAVLKNEIYGLKNDMLIFYLKNIYIFFIYYINIGTILLKKECSNKKLKYKE